MNTHSPKSSTTEAYKVMQEMSIASGLSIKELAEANGCSCGYELQKKIQSELESKNEQ